MGSMQDPKAATLQTKLTAITSWLGKQCTLYLPYLRTALLPQGILLQPVLQWEWTLQDKQDNQFPTGNELVLFAVTVTTPVQK